MRRQKERIGKMNGFDNTDFNAFDILESEYMKECQYAANIEDRMAKEEEREDKNNEYII